MFDPKKLLQHEYFPEELPDCFTSKGLADNYNVLKGQANSICIPSSPFLFSIYKGENARRRMAIPNPLNYMRIVNCICDNCEQLKNLFNNSQLSLTKPSNNQNDTQKRAYNRISNSPTETRLANEKLFSNNSVCIKMDISNFFDSIYTHSVSWAIHGKKDAKANRTDKSILGNQIDSALQNLNDKQTHGILVGNAISRIVAELILCDIDSKIQKEFPNANVCRFVDDYSFYITDKESSTAIISFVRNQLLEYDLVLNESKTKIIHAPFLLERNGIDEIKSITTEDAYAYYNRMMLLYDKYKDVSLLKYGFSVINLLTRKIDFSKMFPLLVHSLVTFPSLAYKILPILYKYKDDLTANEKKELKNALLSIASNGVELRQETETVWALWAITLFGLKLNEEIVRLVCASNNDLAIIISLTYIKENGYKYYTDVVNTLIERIKEESTDPTTANRAMIFFSHWLPIYELVRKDIVQISDFPCVEENKFFKKMLDNNIDFYDTSVVPVITQSSKKENHDYNEIVSLLKKLLDAQKDVSAKTEVLDSIDKIVQGKSEKWIYK